MKQDCFKYLPSDVIIDILSRLCVRSIARSKCVCKPWLHLLETDEFANSYLAKAVHTLVVLEPLPRSNWCTIFEFEVGEDLERRYLHYNPLTRLDFPHPVIIEGSANGLIFLLKYGPHDAEARYIPEAYYVCNPITREYVEVSCPKELLRSVEDHLCINYGFGASEKSGKHKVVRICHDPVIAESKCHVHTLGTESWRHVEPGALLDNLEGHSCIFLNGNLHWVVSDNLHWVVSDSGSKLWISCFNLETECFSTFSTPPLHERSWECIGGLSVLGHCLCFCDNTEDTGEDEAAVIWLMKEYGVEESWTKAYAIRIKDVFDLEIEGFELVYPIKVFKDGDFLMLWDGGLFYYSSKSETVQEIDILDAYPIYSILLTPSFLPLKSLGIENVISF